MKTVSAVPMEDPLTTELPAVQTQTPVLKIMTQPPLPQTQVWPLLRQSPVKPANRINDPNLNPPTTISLTILANRRKPRPANTSMALV